MASNAGFGFLIDAITSGVRRAVARPSAQPLSQRFRRASVVAATLFVAHGVWLAGVAAMGVEPSRLALIGSYYLDQGRGTSLAIDSLRGSDVGPGGYDGQFALFTALDPTGAKAYMDDPAYRYGRILYPLAARAAAAGQDGAIPWALLLINVAAAAVLTFCVAYLLCQAGTSPWFALLVGLSPGLNVAVVRDLTEPLGYALAALALTIVVSRNDRRSFWTGSFVFALAGLARETALLFAVATAVSLALGIRAFGDGRRRPHLRDGLMLLCIAIAPAVVWRLAASDRSRPAARRRHPGCARSCCPRRARPDPRPVKPRVHRVDAEPGFARAAITRWVVR